MARKRVDDCLRELRWLYDRRQLAEPKAGLKAWIEKWQCRCPKLVSWVEDNIEERWSCDVAVAFPALLALVQFETPGPFVALVLSLTAIQLAIGSMLEPMLMGSTLNMSPFAIILSLTFWGTVWGVVGCF
jgi:hypothetical protein